MPNQESESSKAPSVWMRMIYRYSAALVLGIALLAYIFPQLHEGASKLQMIGVLLGGVLCFGGGFGIAVSLFFHLWHKK
ncbi:MAG: hypothetical protein R8K49_07855 [Mariprofundaceae bacterium]